MTQQDIQSNQSIRVKRWFIALLAYVLVFAAVTVARFLGLGSMPPTAFLAFFLIAVIGNIVFGSLIISGKNLAFKDPSLTLPQMIFSYIWGVIPLYYLPEARLVVIVFYLPSFSFGILRLNLRGHIKAACTIIALYWIVLIVEYVQQRPNFVILVELFQFVLFILILSWFVFFGSYVSNLRHKSRQKNRELRKAQTMLEEEIARRRDAQVKTEALVQELRGALSKVKTLKGMVPICANCKKIRDDLGFWKQLEAYLADHSDAEFSHGLCPDCAEEFRKQQ